MSTCHTQPNGQWMLKADQQKPLTVRRLDACMLQGILARCMQSTSNVPLWRLYAKQECCQGPSSDLEYEREILVVRLSLTLCYRWTADLSSSGDCLTEHLGSQL